jgi:anti-sigma factor RsiW
MADAWTAKLDPYLDGELSGGEMKDLDAHVRSCAACAADVLNRVRLRRAVQSAGRRYSPSSEFRAQVLKKMAAPRWAYSWRLWTAAAVMTAVVLVAVITTYSGKQRWERGQAFSEIADMHVAALASPNPVDVVSSDRHTVKPWFQGRIPFAFDLPELQTTEFTLIGGRVAYLEQAPGVALIYQVRKHQISVFMFQSRASSAALESHSGPQKQMSFNMESGEQDGLRYFVVGDASVEDIAKLSELLKAAARQ